MLSARISSYGCTWEVWRAREKRKSCLRRIREQLLLLQCSRNSIIAEWRIGNPLNGFLSFFFFNLFSLLLLFFFLEEQKHFIASCYLISCTVMLTHFLYSGIDRALWEKTKEKQTEHYVYLWKVKTWWSHYERMVAHRNGFLSFLIFLFSLFLFLFSVKKDKSTFLFLAEMPQRPLFFSDSRETPYPSLLIEAKHIISKSPPSFQYFSYEFIKKHMR